MNQSGAGGRIEFTDNGGESHDGVASGLDGSADRGTYVSLVYDNRASGGQDAGPNKEAACEPVVDGPGMFLRVWVVDADGHGTLVGSIDRMSISTFRTVSIRDTGIDGPFGPATGPAAVVACGNVATHGQN
jgi:hypothetical protein